MSLRAFHIFFICVSTLCAIFCGTWCFQAAASQESSPFLLLGVLCIGFAIGLMVYGIMCFKKLPHVDNE